LKNGNFRKIEYLTSLDSDTFIETEGWSKPAVLSVGHVLSFPYIFVLLLFYTY
jgi:hypothetical protein